MIYNKNVQKAIKFATKTHNHYQQQVRKGKVIPYIAHPLTVGMILCLAGASEEVVLAGILHDTIEDSIEEKKVTAEMLAERFGDNVAKLVLSVTEEDRAMSWAERKQQAFEHISEFSHESLLVKSADVISNVSEILDDYERVGDEVFSYFSGTKEQTIDHQLRTISAIIDAWPKNPLTGDLANLAGILQVIKMK